MLAYYRYTTARILILLRNSVGPPGIEPGLYEPESYVLPVYYGPIEFPKSPAMHAGAPFRIRT